MLAQFCGNAHVETAASAVRLAKQGGFFVTAGKLSHHQALSWWSIDKRSVDSKRPARRDPPCDSHSKEENQQAH